MLFSQTEINTGVGIFQGISSLGVGGTTIWFVTYFMKHLNNKDAKHQENLDKRDAEHKQHIQELLANVTDSFNKQAEQSRQMYTERMEFTSKLYEHAIKEVEKLTAQQEQLTNELKECKQHLRR